MSHIDPPDGHATKEDFVEQDEEGNIMKPTTTLMSFMFMGLATMGYAEKSEWTVKKGASIASLLSKENGQMVSSSSTSTTDNDVVSIVWIRTTTSLFRCVELLTVDGTPYKEGKCFELGLAR